MDGCVDDALVAAIVAGEASAESLERVKEHAARCDACRELLAAAGRVRAVDAAERARERTQPSHEAITSEGSPKPARPIEPGADLGRYTLVKEVGRGGMGVVFEGHDPGLDRRVAIKLLHHTGSVQQLARMSREAQAVAKLSHPNVVKIFDVGLRGDQAFIVMEFVEGITLKEWVQARAPSWRRILRTFAEAGAGLAAAHAAELVHRDFKPANVIVDARGHVTVLDFGLARGGGDSGAVGAVVSLGDGGGSTLTATGIAVGTPSYMAPEQHQGGRVDAQADVFSFGVALFEALYRRLPFKGRTVQMLYDLKRDGPPHEPPTSTVPAEVYAVVRKALAVDPDERWRSMDELLAALRKTTRRRSRAALFVGSLGVVALAAALISDPFGAPASVDTAVTAPVVDEALEAEAQRLVETSVEQGLARHPAEALGTAYAALLVANASGSPLWTNRAAMQIGGALIDTGRYLLAAEHLREAVERAEAQGDDQAATLGATRLIYALGVLDRPDEALEVGKFARVSAERAGDDGTLLVGILENEATALPLGRSRERIERGEKALAMRRGNPKLSKPRALAMALNNFGSTLMGVDNVRAKALLEEALAIRVEILGENDRDTIATETSLVSLRATQGEFRDCIEAGTALSERLDEDETRVRLAVAELVGLCHFYLTEFEEGLVWAELAIDLADKLGRKTGSMHARRLEIKAMMLPGLGRAAEAEELFMRALAIRESLARGPSYGVAQGFHNLGSIARDAGDLRRSEAYERRALAEFEEVGDRLGLLYTRLGLAKTLNRLERHEEAASIIAPEVGALGTAKVAIDPMLVAAAQFVYAEALYETTEDRAYALGLARGAMELLSRRGDFANDYEHAKRWLEARSQPP